MMIDKSLFILIVAIITVAFGLIGFGAWLF